MNLVKIKYFNSNNQKRVSLVKLVRSVGNDYSLKESKEALDKMLDGTPIEISISDEALPYLEKRLQELDLTFEVESKGTAQYPKSH